MGRTRFRILIGLIAFAHLVAASELGALFGFVAIWAMVFAVALVAMVASIVPGAGEFIPPPWMPEAVISAIGFAVIAAAGRQLMSANAARIAGDHGNARRRAISGLSIASVPTCLCLSVLALADAWP